MSHSHFLQHPTASFVHRSPGWLMRLTYRVGDWRRCMVDERQSTTEAVPSFDPAALRRLRRARGLSHDALGAEVGISRPSLISYEKGTRGIGVHNLHLLARALGVDPLELTTATRATATIADLRARVGLRRTDLAGLLGIHRTMGSHRTGEPSPQAGADVGGGSGARGERGRGAPGPRSGQAVVSELTQRRHFGLRHRLGATEAAEVAEPFWVADRIRHYAAVAKLGPVAAVVSAQEHEARTGRTVGPNTWGNADWSGPELLVYVDPFKCRTKGVAELVVAHEVGHLRWRSYRHRAVFFTRVQQLIDRASRPGAGTVGETEEADLSRSGAGYAHTSGKGGVT